MSLEAGRSIGSYTIGEQIGKGGMGEVYSAYQHSTNRTVAIKLLNTRLENESDGYLRFQREVAIIAQLEHPHILPVYDFGEVDGRPYVVMRYMNAGTLDEQVDSLSLEQRIEILRQIADTLDSAHNWGVIHRDLKPSNILLDEAGFGYLGDFGLAKTMSGAQSLTRTGGIVGTPAFMSPEQARGEELTPSSDIYSFAIMSYQLICGEHPFPSQTPIDYLSQHLIAEPPSIRKKMPALPPLVDALLLQGMAKEAEKRPDKATDLILPIQKAIGKMPAIAQTNIPVQAQLNDQDKTNIYPTIVSQTMMLDSGIMPNVAPTPPKPNHIWRWAMPAFVLLLLSTIGLWQFDWLPAFIINKPYTLTQYPVGDSPRAIAQTDDAIWVANSDEDSVSRLAIGECDAGEKECRQAVTTYPASALPVALTGTNNKIWVASSLEQAIIQLDAGSGEPIQKFSLPYIPSNIVLLGDILSVLHEFDKKISIINVTNGEQSMFDVADAPAGILATEQNSFITYRKGQRVEKFQSTDNSYQQSILMDELVGEMAWWQDSLWVTLPQSNQIAQIEPNAGTVLQRIEVGDQPTALTAGDEFLWVGNSQGNDVVGVDSAGNLTSPIPLPDQPTQLQWRSCGDDCDELWVLSNPANAVWRVQYKP